MPQVVLDGAQVVPLVRQRIAAGMAQHVRMDFAQIGALTDAADQVVDTLAGELPPSLGDEQPRQSRIPDPQVAPDRPQLIAVDRVVS